MIYMIIFMLFYINNKQTEKIETVILKHQVILGNEDVDDCDDDI